MFRIRAASSPRRKARRPSLEQLEGRELLASLSVGPNVNITRATGNQAESTISVDPNNNQHVFEDDTISTVGHYSTDGGATWQTSNTSALPASLGDVQTAWDSFGNLFLTEFGNTSGNLTVIVALSTNGGQSFSRLATLPGSGFDQPTIAVGPGQTPGSGSVWVSVNNSANNFVSTGATVTGLGAVGAFGALQTAGAGDFGSTAIGPSGQVLVDYQNNGSGEGPDTIRTNLDPNGLAAGGFNATVTATSTNVGGFAHIPAQPTRSIDAEANLAWDRSGGPHNGRVYLVYVDRANTTTADTDIFLRFSDDNGSTWSARTRINDDASGNGKSQFNPALAVDQSTGEVAVTWYDTRNSGASNNSAQIFGTVSLDGGISFLPNVQISAGTSIASTVDPNFEFGDYDLMDFSNGVFYRSWADNSNSTGDNPNGTTRLDIYTARVTVNTDVAPTITLNPTNQSVTAGQTATFMAAASGTPTPTVQWFVNTGSGFVAIPGATSTTLTLTNVQTSQSGNLYEAVFTNTAGSATTTAATLTVAPVPAVVSTGVDIGTAQRSMVRSIDVTFNQVVTLDPGTFQLMPSAGVQPVTVLFTTSTVSGQTVAHVTFAGAGILGGSLEDGSYTLTTLASHVHNANNVGLAADSTLNFFRFYGDSNGDGIVDGTDFIAFRLAYLAGDASGANSIYDFNGDGIFTTADSQAFINNYRKRVLS